MPWFAREVVFDASRKSRVKAWNKTRRPRQYNSLYWVEAFLSNISIARAVVFLALYQKHWDHDKNKDRLYTWSVWLSQATVEENVVANTTVNNAEEERPYSGVSEAKWLCLHAKVPK